VPSGVDKTFATVFLATTRSRMAMQFLSTSMWYIARCFCIMLHCITKWLEVGFGGQPFPCGWPHYPETRIESAPM